MGNLAAWDLVAHVRTLPHLERLGLVASRTYLRPETATELAKLWRNPGLRALRPGRRFTGTLAKVGEH